MAISKRSSVDLMTDADHWKRECEAAEAEVARLAQAADDMEAEVARLELRVQELEGENDILRAALRLAATLIPEPQRSEINAALDA